MHALFNKDNARNKWIIGASVLRSFIEHFGSATEQLDLYSEDGRVTLTSYTEKIMNGRGACDCARLVSSGAAKLFRA